MYEKEKSDTKLNVNIQIMWYENVDITAAYSEFPLHSSLHSLGGAESCFAPRTVVASSLLITGL